MPAFHNTNTQTAQGPCPSQTKTQAVVKLKAPHTTSIPSHLSSAYKGSRRCCHLLASTLFPNDGCGGVALYDAAPCARDGPGHGFCRLLCTPVLSTATCATIRSTTACVSNTYTAAVCRGCLCLCALPLLPSPQRRRAEEEQRGPPSQRHPFSRAFLISQLSHPLLSSLDRTGHNTASPVEPPKQCRPSTSGPTTMPRVALPPHASCQHRRRHSFHHVKDQCGSKKEEDAKSPRATKSDKKAKTNR